MWIRMKSGKSMPVDENIIIYRTDPQGKDRIVTPSGDVVSCVAGADIRDATGFGYMSHFATCPNAGKHGKNTRKGKDNG